MPAEQCTLSRGFLGKVQRLSQLVHTATFEVPGKQFLEPAQRKARQLVVDTIARVDEGALAELLEQHTDTEGVLEALKDAAVFEAHTAPKCLLHHQSTRNSSTRDTRNGAAQQSWGFWRRTRSQPCSAR